MAEGKMKKGTKVKLVNMSEVVAAFSNSDNPNVYLILDEFYTVHNIDIKKWYTQIMVDEMPGRWFNSSHFEFIYEEKNG